ncbi:hypothetical protein VSDG_02902 [Cytospora chrysosperma]|uniref:Aminotransferase class V domain-containing protein n=1 Tax=Cytospora chrysosperma TaxID=252740 RepID=A0A423WCL8_CYTCH|nr:hypothetical protein VSDG_02902 [Valsa sordida]
MAYPLKFGKDLRKEFLFDPDYHNLNHGSFGTIPAHIQQKLHHYQTLHERRPDQFIRYDYPRLLDENREAIARLLNAPSVDEVVFVSNATVGVNVVLRNLSEIWSEDGKDEIIHFNTIYGGCGKTVDYVVDSTYGRVSNRTIELTYPVTNEEIITKFKEAVRQSREVEGKRPRVALFDAVSSIPGVRFPFEAMVQACRELGILSLVDGAQGVGMVDFDLTALDPDFWVSNCHKWLFSPRGCAVFYVPKRNQHLMRSTLPTSHGYVPKPRHDGKVRANPLPPSEKDVFVNAFEFIGTLDNSPYLCVKDAIEWREKVLGGEERIRDYLWTLAKEGGAKVADLLGTWVMENPQGEGHGLTDCAMVNVALPLVVAPEDGNSPSTSTSKAGKPETREGDVEEAAPVNTIETGEGLKVQGREGDMTIPHKDAQRAWEWMTKVLVDEYKTFLPMYLHEGRFWARLSAQVYLDMDDFEWGGNTLKVLCERAARKDYDQ